MTKFKYLLAAGLASAAFAGQAGAQVSLTPTPDGLGVTGPAGNTVTLGSGGVGYAPAGSFSTPGYSSQNYYDQGAGYYAPSTSYYTPSTSYYTPATNYYAPSSSFYTPSAGYYTPGYSSGYSYPSTGFYTPGYSTSHFYAPSSGFYAPGSSYYRSSAWNPVNTVRTARRLFR